MCLFECVCICWDSMGSRLARVQIFIYLSIYLCVCVYGVWVSTLSSWVSIFSNISIYCKSIRSWLYYFFWDIIHSKRIVFGIMYYQTLPYWHYLNINIILELFEINANKVNKLFIKIIVILFLVTDFQYHIYIYVYIYVCVCVREREREKERERERARRGNERNQTEYMCKKVL